MAKFAGLRPLKLVPNTDMVTVKNVPVSAVQENALSSALHSIVTVKFVNTSLTVIPVDCLQSLPQLEELTIRFVYQRSLH